MRISDWSSDVCSSDLGSGQIIPEFVSIPGTLGKKLIALPLDVQSKLKTEAVETVTGGTGTRPITKHIMWYDLQPEHAAQVFDGSRIRTVKEQIIHRIKKAKKAAPSYVARPQGDRKSTRLNSSH